MPNRVIKETIRTSRSVNNMTDFQFRLWVYLITYVDDYGRGSADPELLKGFVFPRRKRVSESDIQKALAELAGMGCILLYEVDGESYFCFPNWGDHQRIQTKKSKFPAPEEGIEIHGESRWKTVNGGDAPPESESNPNPNPNPKESKRARKAEKKVYGIFKNVLLTDEEYENLGQMFPGKRLDLIDKLSRGIESKGYKYKSHYATILNWADREGIGQANKLSELEIEAIKRIMGESNSEEGANVFP